MNGTLRLITRALLASCLTTPLGCQSPAPSTAGRAPLPVAAPETCSLDLAESWPIETSLDHGDIPDARNLWPSLIAGAKRSVDIASFYVSASGNGALEPTLQAMEAAARRGVRVRVLVDSKLATTYADSVAKVRALPGVSVVVWDAEKDLGGVHHAKYMVIDSVHVFVGSQNLDDRSLEHIQELGIGGNCPPVAAALGRVFERDWRVATGASHAGEMTAPDGVWPRAIAREGGGLVTLTLNPKGGIPSDAAWDLDSILGMVDGATRSVDLQLLSFRPRNRDGSRFNEWLDALRRSVSRGARVRLLVSHWIKEKDIPVLNEVATAGVDVRIVHIAPWSGGEVPFGRVAHAKYMIVDGAAAWIGTSNGEGDYFIKGRNVGVIVRGGPIPPRLSRFFEDDWRIATPPRALP